MTKCTTQVLVRCEPEGAAVLQIHLKGISPRAAAFAPDQNPLR